MARPSCPDRRPGRCLPAVALAVAIALAAAPAAPQPPGTPDRAEQLRAQERRAADRLQVLQREADALAGQQRGVLDRLRALELQRDLAAVEATRATAALGAAEADLASLTARRAAVQRAMDARRPEIQARLLALYEAGPSGDLRRWLMVETMAEATAAGRLLAAVTARDRREFAAFSAQRAELDAQDEALRRQREALARARAATEAARVASSEAAARHEALVRDLDRRRDLAARLTGELQAAHEALQKQLDGLPAAGGTTALPIAPFRGTLPWPAAGRVVGRYGRTATSRFGTAVPRNGIEIAAPEGTPVRAVHEGRVAFAGEFAGLGRLVILDHGGSTFSLYGYLQELDVQRGAAVERGGVVGLSGRSPSGEGVVYFELRVDARPVNPLEWLHR